jgi:hypothetical protein
MTADRIIEYRITRQLLRRREGAPGAVRTSPAEQGVQPWADRLIAILAVTTGLLLVGSYIEELLWVVVAATTVVTLR